MKTTRPTNCSLILFQQKVEHLGAVEADKSPLSLGSHVMGVDEASNW